MLLHDAAPDTRNHLTSHATDRSDINTDTQTLSFSLRNIARNSTSHTFHSFFHSSNHMRNALMYNCIHKSTYVYENAINWIIYLPTKYNSVFCSVFIPDLSMNDYATPWMQNCKHTPIIYFLLFFLFSVVVAVAVFFTALPTNTEAKQKKNQFFCLLQSITSTLKNRQRDKKKV